MITCFQNSIKFYHFLALDRDKDALTMALDDKSERLAELEAISKQNDLAGGQNRQTISKLNQEIELLQDQIDDLERKESQSRKLLDEKVKKILLYLLKSLSFIKRSIESELLASRERATREKRELDEKLTLLVNENEALSKELKLVQEQRNKATVDNTDNSERVLVLEVHALNLTFLN